MIRYTINRILWLILILICVFHHIGLLELAPGSIIDTMITEEMTTGGYRDTEENTMDKPRSPLRPVHVEPLTGIWHYRVTI